MLYIDSFIEIAPFVCLFNGGNLTPPFSRDYYPKLWKNGICVWIADLAVSADPSLCRAVCRAVCWAVCWACSVCLEALAPIVHAACIIAGVTTCNTSQHFTVNTCAGIGFGTCTVFVVALRWLICLAVWHKIINW